MRPPSTLNRDAFAPYYRGHEGESGVLVCTGPSLVQWEPDQFTGRSRWILFGMNDCVWYNRADMDYLFVQDTKPWSANGYYANSECYDSYEATSDKFAGRSPHNPCVRSIPEERYCDGDWTPYEIGHEGACEWTRRPDIDCLGDGQSVAFSAAQFALWTGIATLGIVGVDLDSPHNAFEQHKNGFNPYAHYRHAEKWANFIEWTKTAYPNVELLSIGSKGLRGLIPEYEHK